MRAIFLAVWDLDKFQTASDHQGHSLLLVPFNMPRMISLPL